MFGKRKEKLQDDDLELFGQEVSEESIDKFDLPSDEELDDIDLALESATLRDDASNSKTVSSDEDWDSITHNSKNESVTSELSSNELRQDALEINDKDVLTDEDIVEDEAATPNDPVDSNKILEPQNKGVSKASFFATVLVVVALTGSAFLYMFNILKETTATTERIDNTVTQLISSDADIRLDIDKLANESTVNLEKLQLQVDSLNDSKAEIIKTTSNLAEQVQSIQTDLLANNTKLEAALSSLQTLSSEMTSVENNLSSAISGIKKDVQAKSPTTAPIVNSDNVLEGATLESVDLWNYTSYANLRTAEGNWISLAVTEKYKGWSIKHINKDSVVFTRNEQNKTLFIKG